jgi:hypothetical protein
MTADEELATIEGQKEVLVGLERQFLEGRFCELRPNGVLGSPRGPGPVPTDLLMYRAGRLRSLAYMRNG